MSHGDCRANGMTIKQYLTMQGAYCILHINIRRGQFFPRPCATQFRNMLSSLCELWADFSISVRKLFVCFFKYVCWIWGSCKFEMSLLLKNTVIVEVRYRFFLGFHPVTFHKPRHFEGFCFILPLQILHNLLADRPAPRGAAGGAGGGPPCKSKITTFKIFF